MGLGQALSTAVSGLRVTQSNLALVASNIANAETPGYVRKSASQVAARCRPMTSVTFRQLYSAQGISGFVPRTGRFHRCSALVISLCWDHFVRL